VSGHRRPGPDGPALPSLRPGVKGPAGRLRVDARQIALLKAIHCAKIEQGHTPASMVLRGR
jgi:hypothetical protein